LQVSITLQRYNALNLYFSVLRKRCHCNTGTRRLVFTEICAVHFIYLCKIIHIYQENGCLYNILFACSRFRHDRVQIFQRERRLLFHSLRDHVSVFNVKAKLSGNKEITIALHCLYVWTDRRRSFLGIYNFFHLVFFLSFSVFSHFHAAAQPVERLHAPCIMSGFKNARLFKDGHLSFIFYNLQSRRTPVSRKRRLPVRRRYPAVRTVPEQSLHLQILHTGYGSLPL